ncbi:ATP-dependent DNA helicase [Mesomycoplasma neurolyticum]|uniref:Exodeoxyribonuclease V C-terminal n=1 Tax=Mesomycoplasma neurolyticum TaxID=2120 RepID=A0A449A5N5_9BACT|nr:AAA family ATPase [Mesomycoplasma neurolyticum]VEU59571.1 exodeoxyribonuclease V C-terminal fragment [Mesomycoplasma neurolyticum]
MLLIKGKVKYLIWASENKNFFIYIFESIENEKYKIKTNIELLLNKSYELTLNKVNHIKYGESWEVIEQKIIDPENKKDIIQYFSSNLFNKIGKKIAEKIYDKWGDNSIKILKKEPDKIFEISSIINIKKAQIIFDTLNIFSLEFTIKDFFILNSISINFYNKINTFINIVDEWENIKINPFLILEKFYDDFTFDEIDKLALAIGIKENDINRIIFLILDKISKNILNNSDTFFTKNDIPLIYNLITKNIFISKDEFFNIWKLMFRNKYLIFLQDKNAYSPFFLFEKEKFIVEQLIKVSETKENIKAEILSEHLDKQQQKAVKIALKNSLSIITGAPGTGKSEILKYIYWNINQKYNQDKIAVLTPTGKAAIRLKEKANFQVKTIHSFLQSEKINEQYVIKNPIKKNINVLIIDEFSMVDLKLFFNLLESINIWNLKKIILIGDQNQLPSISFGELLRDFINSNFFQVIFLEKNYRQKDKLGIIDDALKVNKQMMPLFNTKESNFIEIKEKKFYSQLDKIFNEILKEYEIKDIIILSANYKGEVGIEKINEHIQKKFFKKKDNYFLINNKRFYIGDRVIQIENNIENNVMNGEIGYIENIAIYKDKIQFIHVKFENDKNVKYTEFAFKQYLNLAYCISIHKFQGSESKVVILSIFSQFTFILNKKLIYTGMTRAQSLLKVIGNKEIFYNAIQKDNSAKNTNIIYFFEKNNLANK